MTQVNAGLGVVHGLASAIGGRFPAPHGVICEALLSSAVRANMEWLTKERGAGDESLKKYARAGALLAGRETGDVSADCRLLVETIDAWTRDLGLPLLGEYGMGPSDIDGVLEDTSLKNNPAALGGEELRAILEGRI